jgi:hypothetical protein
LQNAEGEKPFIARLQRFTIPFAPNPRPLAWAVTSRAFGALKSVSFQLRAVGA